MILVRLAEWRPHKSLGSCRWRWRGAWHYRGTMLERFYWDSLSRQAQQTAVVLVAAKSDPDKFEQVAQQRLPRLLKEDLLPILRTLFEEGQTQVATRVFHHIQKEFWYGPDPKFYKVVVRAFMDGSCYEELGKVWDEMELSGCVLDKPMAYELIRQCISAKQLDLAFRMFNTIKSSEHATSDMYWMIIESLNKCGEFEASLKVEEELFDRLDQKKTCRHSLNVGIHKFKPWAS